MKIAVIGNCQVIPFGAVLETVLPKAECHLHEVWRMTGEACDAAAARLDEHDLVIAQPLSARYGRLSVESLRADPVRDRTVFIHNLYCLSPFPGCSYVGPLGRRVPSPLSRYHSRLVLDAFLAGWDADCATRALVTGVGPLGPARPNWTEALDELHAREVQVDVPFAADLEAFVRERDGFFLFNHPRLALIETYAGRILGHVGLGDGRPVVSGLPDPLEVFGTWPVWPWVAEALGLPYSRETLTAPYSLARMLPEDFVARCYTIYAETPREHLT